jgi:hypothetical protein
LQIQLLGVRPPQMQLRPPSAVPRGRTSQAFVVPWSVPLCLV